MKKLSIFLLIGLILVSLLWLLRQKDEEAGGEEDVIMETFETMTEVEEVAEEKDYSPDVYCENSDEVEFFDEPIPVVWEARIDGCLVGCQGASFTRVPEDIEYDHPRFSGYLAENWSDDGSYSSIKTIDEKFMADNVVLRVYGDMLSVDYEYVDSVFGGRCVPVLDINRLEVIE